MAPLNFISLSVGSLLLLRATHATLPKQEQMANNCVDEFNTARSAVGFPKYTPLVTEMLSDTPTLENVCQAIKDGDETGKNSVQPEYNFIYVVQDENSCSKVVQTINAAFEKIGTALPPVYHKKNTDSLYNQQTINFMALYNPVAAEVSCSFITCENEKQRRRLSEGNPIKAVACSVKPGTVIDGAAPYQQEDYNKILAVFAPSSASAAVPTFLALAAAAAGIAFM